MSVVKKLGFTWNEKNDAQLRRKLKGLHIYNVTNGGSVSLDRLTVGTTMDDGTIYVGISPETHRPLYAAPADAAPQGLNYSQAEAYAQSLEVGGKHDFRLPSKEELNMLFQLCETGALKSTFNLMAVYYHASTPGDIGGQSFRNGESYQFSWAALGALRCVR